jgi:hypothetical protein
MTRHLPALSVISCLALGCSPTALGDDEETVEDDSQRCLNARSIRGADVIDDNHLIFEIQGRRLYLNVLPKSCVGLSRDRRFSYDIYTRSLCARDKIRILKEAGDGFYEGKSCSLGRFQPITYEELEIFLEERSFSPEPKTTEPPDVEEVVTE